MFKQLSRIWRCPDDDGGGDGDARWSASLSRSQPTRPRTTQKIYGPGSILENEASLTSPENCLIATEHLSFPEKEETKSLICVVVVGIVVVVGVFKLV